MDGIKVTVGEGHTLKQFQDVLEQRMKWLGQSAVQACVATALDLMRSIRARCKVAKPAKAKVDVALDGSFSFGFTMVGKGQKKPCIRKGGKVRFQPTKNEKVIYCSIYPAKSIKVYKWVYERPEKQAITYYLAASSKSQATARCKKILKGRINKFKGLAKAAWTTLMIKTHANGNMGNITNEAKKVANEQTVSNVSKMGNGCLVSL